ncbi:Wall-associated kinase family protein [Rhynchospora pubera]|uniref:Wall-associated kinase family protein n=1 Tax=Rhynchospora pubera TaxID=906938 RepID=A0AAV8GDT7_9POAL|nr:Wall-associated kinase family protein [Rhynchospora pubera]
MLAPASAMKTAQFRPALIPNLLDYIEEIRAGTNNTKTGLLHFSTGSCSGIGCCQTSIPIGTYTIEFLFDQNFSDFNAGPCNYAMLTEEDGFNFSTKYVTTDMLSGQYKPAVFDWAIAKTTGLGYICNCSKGYQGNPYLQLLQGGCKDIDECANHNPCSNGGKCHNLQGSYKCSCPFGWRNKQNNLRESERNWALIIGIVAFGNGAAVLPLLLALLSLKRRLDIRRNQKLRQKFFKQNYDLLHQRLISSTTEDTTGRMKIFGIADLEKATSNFDQARILGCGGHGTVYKGILSDLRVVAIKRSNTIIESEIDQFINEIVILSQVNHRNVVKLLGCCLETEVPLLVYEFISNGTLSDHLHVEGRNSLPWKDQIRIALETARAISYLHSAASISVFHRDLKCTNILLDDCLTAKLSDFGASKSVKIDQTGLTTAIQGTYGYLDPEYYYTGRLTEKSDVYSFGVILAELLTRKKAYSSSTPSENGNLIAQFLKVVAENRLFDIIDSQILEEGPVEQLEEVAMLIERCLRMKGEERPGMKEVEVRLELIWDSKKGSAHPPMPTSQYLVKQMSIPRITAVGDDKSRQYSLEEEMLLSAKFGR